MFASFKLKDMHMKTDMQTPDFRPRVGTWLGIFLTAAFDGTTFPMAITIVTSNRDVTVREFDLDQIQSYALAELIQNIPGFDEMREAMPSIHISASDHTFQRFHTFLAYLHASEHVKQ